MSCSNAAQQCWAALLFPAKAKQFQMFLNSLKSSK